MAEGGAGSSSRLDPLTHFGPLSFPRARGLSSGGTGMGDILSDLLGIWPICDIDILTF